MNTPYDRFLEQVVNAAKASVVCGRAVSENKAFRAASEIAMTFDLSAAMIDHLYADAFCIINKLRFPKLPLPEYTRDELRRMNN